MQGRAHDPVDAAAGGRLDAFLPAPGQQLVTDPFGAALGLSDVGDQPLGELVGVGDAALPEPQRPADLAAVELNRAARPVVERRLGRRHANLPSHVIHRGVEDLAPAAGKPAALGVEAQQQREAEPCRATLAGHQRQLVLNQRPPVDQLVLIQLSRHARTLLPQPDTAPTRESALVCGW
jgi:hypothetical protein